MLGLRFFFCRRQAFWAGRGSSQGKTKSTVAQGKGPIQCNQVPPRPSCLGLPWLLEIGEGLASPQAKRETEQTWPPKRRFLEKPLFVASFRDLVGGLEGAGSKA